MRPRVIALENVEEFQDWSPLTAGGKRCPIQKGVIFKQFVASNDEFNTLLVSYGSAQNQAHMKTFIQERLASYLLATGDYFTITSTRLLTRPVIHRLFPHGDADRKLFLLCDRLKRLYRKTHNKAYLDSFYLTRQQITFKRPY